MMMFTAKQKSPKLTPDPTEKTRQRLLVVTLAATDALFRVFRSPDARLSAVLIERRELYQTHGIPWLASRAAGARAEDRKGVRSLIAAVGLSNLLKVNAGGHRVIATKLTDQGYADARAAAGLPSLDESLLILDQLYALRDDPRGFDIAGTGWTRETDLAATEYGLPDVGEKLWDLQELAIPLMVHGLARCGCDIQKRVSYAMTSAGRDLAEKRLKIKPATPRRRGKINYELQNLYANERDSEEEILHSLTPTQPNGIGEIPLPVCPSTRGMIAARAPQALKDSNDETDDLQ